MISKIFFIIICIYILYAIIFAKEKYHLLLLPFIIDSDFFGFSIINKLNIIKDDLVILTVLLIFLYFMTQNRKYPLSRFLKVNNLNTIIFLLFLTLILFISWILYNDYLPSLKVYRIFLRYTAILMFISIFLRLEEQNINKYMELIEKITIVLSVFYILNYSFGIPIFAVESYTTFQLRSVTISRNFLALPYFSSFLLYRICLKRDYKWFDIAGIFVILITIFLTYTRNFIISSVFFTFIALFLRAIKFSKNIFGIIKVTFLTTLICVILVVILIKIFPNQLNYFKSRIENITTVNRVIRDKNANIRIEIIKSRVSKVLKTNPVTGLGFVHENSRIKDHLGLWVRKNDKPGQIIVGDQSWGTLIALIGFGGCLLLLYLFFYPMGYLIVRKIFIQQDINSIASNIFLVHAATVAAFFTTVFVSNIVNVSFYLGLVVFYGNYYYTTKYGQ